MDRMILTTLRLPARLEAALTKHTVANLRAQRRAAPGAAPTVHDLVATQMDRSYATAHRVMREARHRLPSYTPRRVLDFGAGQSPMAWAAQASWPGAPLQVCAPSLTLPLPLPLTLTLTVAHDEQRDARAARGVDDGRDQDRVERARRAHHHPVVRVGLMAGLGSGSGLGLG